METPGKPLVGQLVPTYSAWSINEQKIFLLQSAKKITSVKEKFVNKGQYNCWITPVIIISLTIRLSYKQGTVFEVVKNHHKVVARVIYL